MRLSSKEINVRKVKTLMKHVQTNKTSKIDAVQELNQRFERMKMEDEPWFEDLYPKYIALMKIA